MKTLCFFFACAIMSCSVSAADADAALFNESVVWSQNEDSVSTNHVYGLAVSARGTILAFSEGRVDPKDEGPHHLLLKRSIDNGKTWSPSVYIEKCDGEFLKAHGTLNKKESWSNPAALADLQSGRVFIFYVLNEGSKDQSSSRVFFRYSDDDGVTWLPKPEDGGRVEITSMFEKNPYSWTFHMPGPGHGIQLNAQKDAAKNGRLILQLWHRRAVTAKPRNYGVSVIYSDDHGKTWKSGGNMGAGHGANESRLVELGDARIMINARGAAAEHNVDRKNTLPGRVYSFSADSGESFSAPEYRDDIKFFQTDGSLARVKHGDKSLLLFSHPGDEKSRTKMTLSLSDDDAKAWARSKLVFEGPSFYSDLVALPDGSVGLLYGKDRSADSKQSWFPAQVVFARFNVAWLMKD